MCELIVNARFFARVGLAPFFRAKEDELVSNLAFEIDETALGAQVAELAFAPPSEPASRVRPPSPMKY